MQCRALGHSGLSSPVVQLLQYIMLKYNKLQHKFFVLKQDRVQTFKQPFLQNSFF